MNDADERDAPVPRSKITRERGRRGKARGIREEGILMLRLVGSRLVSAIPNLIGVIIVTFCLTRALPGDPAAFFAGPAATTKSVEEVRRKLGLDQSLPTQFLLYVRDLAAGELRRIP